MNELMAPREGGARSPCVLSTARGISVFADNTVEEKSRVHPCLLLLWCVWNATNSVRLKSSSHEMYESGRTNTKEKGTQLRPEGRCGGAEITDRVSGGRQRPYIDPLNAWVLDVPRGLWPSPKSLTHWSSGRGCAHEWGRGSDVERSAEI